MKITETIERECCVPKKDFVKLAKQGNQDFAVCRHCGQLWIWNRRAGDMDATYHRTRITEWVAP